MNPTLTIDLDPVALNALMEIAQKERRTPENQAALMLESEIYWERYGQFDKPEDPTQPRRANDAATEPSGANPAGEESAL